MEIQEVKNISTSQLNVMIYGPPGAGKTTFASTFPSPVFLDFDQGLLSIRKSDCKFLPYYNLAKGKDWGEMKGDLLRLKADTGFQTIVLDTISSASDSVMAFVQIVNNRVGKQPNFEDWHSHSSEVQAVIGELRKVTKNLVVIAHEKLEKDELLGRIFGLPMLPGKLAHRIFGMFDEVYHAQIGKDAKGNITYAMNVKGDAYFSAKTRILRGDVVSVGTYEDITKGLR